MEKQELSAVSGIKWKEKFAYGMGEVASGGSANPGSFSGSITIPAY